MPAYIDFETRSAIDIKKVGTYVYSKHDSTQVLCLAYAIDQSEVQLWKPGLPFPEDLSEYVKEGNIVSAHNAVFELNIWNNTLLRTPNLPPLKIENIECTMAKCFSKGLPGKLEEAAIAMKLPIAKDVIGGKVMMQLSRPRKIKGEDISWYEESDSPEKFQILYAYCKQDVEVERMLSKKIKPLSEKEKKIWMLDYKINNTGVEVDVKSIHTALKIIDDEKEHLDARMQYVTNLEVDGCQSVTQITRWVRSQGVDIEGISKTEIRERLLTKLPTNVAEVLKLRSLAGKSSTAKLKLMLESKAEDNRIKEMFQYHGAATGRWAGRRVQLQNLPRPSLKSKEIEDIFKIMAQCEPTKIKDVIDLFYAPPLLAISDCLRSFLIAKEGHRFIVVDWSAIEARVLAWLAGQENILEIFRTSGKIYEHAASGIYRIPMEKVTKDQRFIGKVACIAEGQLVLTDKGLIPIEKVELFHKVWDGVSWVSHEGVVYKGEREVIEYDGLTATTDHIVWTKDGWNICFGECSEKQIPILKTGFGRKEIWMGRSNFSRNKMVWWERQTWTFVEKFSRFLQMLGMQFGKMDKSEKFGKRQIKWVPSMFSTETSSNLVRSSCKSNETKMSKSFGQKFQQLWSERDKIQLQFCYGSWIMDNGEYRIETKFRDRSNRQQWKLRTGESEMGNEERTNRESSNIKSDYRRRYLGHNKKSLFSSSYFIFFKKKILKRIHNRISAFSSNRKKEELERDTAQPNKVRVYDIVNCGSNNRFTVSDCLVHNCLALGYQGGKKAFQGMAKNYGVDISEEQAEEIKIKWREANPKIVNYWYALEEAAINAVTKPGQQFKAGAKGREVTYFMQNCFLYCELPSGRSITYPYAAVRNVDWFGNTKKQISYMTRNGISKKWEESHLYGGLCSENISQAVARDILVDALLELDSKNYKTVMHCHDEIICEMPNGVGSIEEMKNIMCSSSPWAKGLPLGAEGFESTRYKKD